jgi:hypothetical protein
LLQFGSASDLSNVLDSLDARYESHNLTYENQYSTFTPEQLDSIDIVNSFDEFLPMRQFEALFSGFASKRSQLESIENTWLANNLSGTDPDDIDQTYDDAENTISNTNYKVIIGTSTFSLGDDGLQNYSMIAPPISNRNSCGTNRRNSTMYPTLDEARAFKIKVALNTWYVRSGAKGKVVSFKKKNNNWKRARMKLLVVCGGTVYQTEYCGNNFSFQDQNPAPSGYRNRKSLKVARHQPGSNWRTKTAELGSSFDAQNTLQGGVSIK